MIVPPCEMKRRRSRSEMKQGGAYLCKIFKNFYYECKQSNSKVGSGFGKNISNWLVRDKAYPTNVLHLATECSNKNHSAAFPEELPAWFIKLFTKEDDVVLDPFMGSGTTLFVANRMKRHSIGIDNVPEYYEMVKKQISPIDLYLIEPKGKYGSIKKIV